MKKDLRRLLAGGKDIDYKNEPIRSSPPISLNLHTYSRGLDVIHDVYCIMLVSDLDHSSALDEDDQES